MLPQVPTIMVMLGGSTRKGTKIKNRLMEDQTKMTIHYPNLITSTNMKKSLTNYFNKTWLEGKLSMPQRRELERCSRRRGSRRLSKGLNSRNKLNNSHRRSCLKSFRRKSYSRPTKTIGKSKYNGLKQRNNRQKFRSLMVEACLIS